MGDIFNVLLLQNTLRTATPVVLAAMGCLMTQHVNITNIGIDGMMLMGAFFAVVGSYYTGSWVGGIALALLVGLILGLFYYLFVIKIKFLFYLLYSFVKNFIFKNLSVFVNCCKLVCKLSCSFTTVRHEQIDSASGGSHATCGIDFRS